jgi:hypothetical protein
VDAVLVGWLLPVSWEGLTLQLACRPDPQWAASSGALSSLMRQWWGIDLGWRAGEAAEEGGAGEAARGRHTALCFSCGVDSFYSLFYGEPRPTVLLGVGGFDLPLGRRDLMAARREAVRAVARARGLRSIWVETNLRQHPLYRRAPWGSLTHGAALVSVALLLRETIGHLLISSSYHRSNLHPFGSHPDLDPLWSTTFLKVQHFGVDIWRSDKLVRLVDDAEAWPLVSRHLQVCWERPTPGGNCGHCEKCVRLRLTLWKERRGARVLTFPDESEGGLAADIRRLGVLDSAALIPPYRRFLGCGGMVEVALRELLAATVRRCS